MEENPISAQGTRTLVCAVEAAMDGTWACPRKCTIGGAPCERYLGKLQKVHHKEVLPQWGRHPT